MGNKIGYFEIFEGTLYRPELPPKNNKRNEINHQLFLSLSLRPYLSSAKIITWRTDGWTLSFFFKFLWNFKTIIIGQQCQAILNNISRLANLFYFIPRNVYVTSKKLLSIFLPNNKFLHWGQSSWENIFHALKKILR